MTMLSGAIDRVRVFSNYGDTWLWQNMNINNITFLSILQKWKPVMQSRQNLPRMTGTYTFMQLGFAENPKCKNPKFLEVFSLQFTNCSKCLHHSSETLPFFCRTIRGTWNHPKMRKLKHLPHQPAQSHDCNVSLFMALSQMTSLNFP